MPIPKKQSPIVKRKTKGVSIVDQIAPVSEDDDTGITVSVYGRSGTGKTTFACSFPKPILLVGFERGKKSVKKVSGVDYVRVPKTDVLPDLLEEARVGVCRHPSNRGEVYNTIVMDTASTLQAMVLAEILDMEELPAQNSWGMAKQQEYGQMGLQTKEILRHFLRLSETHAKNVVIIAQERNFNDDTGGSESILFPTVGSALSPSVAGWLNPACDYIVQTFIRRKVEEFSVKMKGGKVKKGTRAAQGSEFCLRTAPDPVYTTKFRLPKGTPLPELIVDADYDKMLALINGGD